MENFFESMAENLEGMICIFGKPFTYKSVSYIGVRNEIKNEYDLMIGGQLEKLDMQLVVSKCNFPAPEMGDTLLMNGEVFRIVEIGSDEISYTFKCQSAST